MNFLYSVEQKIHSILVGLDDALDATLPGGLDDVTISARAGIALFCHEHGTPTDQKTINEALLVALANGLDDVEKNHCYLAIAADCDRARRALALLEPYESLVAAVAQS